MEELEGVGSRETGGGLAGSLQSWHRGFCKVFTHCANYGNEKMTFGAGTRLTIKPSKYFIPRQETSPLDCRDQTGLYRLRKVPCPFFTADRDRKQPAFELSRGISGI